MAKLPKLAKLKEGTTSDQITNAILNETAKIYGATPTIRADGTAETRHLIGEYLATDINFSNAFIHELINRVVLAIYQDIYFTNPWKRFKRGYLEAGDMVEEIAFDLCVPHNFDSTADNEYPKQEHEELYTQIHKLNYQHYYKRTISRVKLLQAFNTPDGMRELADQMINIMYTSAEFDEYISMKYMIGRHLLNGYITQVNIPVPSDTTMKQIASTIKGISNDLTILNRNYNRYGLPTSTEKRNQIMLVNTHFDAQFEVDILAYAFNMDKADIYGQRVFITPWTNDDVERMNELFEDEKGYVPFTEEEIEVLNSIPLFILDDRFFMIFDYLMEMTDFYNPEKLYWNYWLHTWRIMSASPFVNAIAFTSTDSTLTGIAISPSAATVAPGSYTNFNAAVTGTGIVSQQVKWQLTGNNSNSSIMNDGLLYVSPSESSGTLTVKASVKLGEKTVEATATVTVTGQTGAMVRNPATQNQSASQNTGNQVDTSENKTDRGAGDGNNMARGAGDENKE